LGRSGPLVFVTVAHEIAVEGVPAIFEEHDIVYRGGASGPAAPAAAAPTGGVPIAAPLWTRALTPDPVLLFRYSALTFNGHRIHYDADYCRAVEGYPGPVVHGPLVATLLLDLIRRNRPGGRVATFAYRAIAPLFCGEELRLAAGVDPARADGLILAATGPEGRLVMTAEAQLRGGA
jgi:3-methylfumaryl-CoA hydratase